MRLPISEPRLLGFQHGADDLAVAPLLSLFQKRSDICFSAFEPQRQAVADLKHGVAIIYLRQAGSGRRRRRGMCCDGYYERTAGRTKGRTKGRTAEGTADRVQCELGSDATPIEECLQHGQEPEQKGGEASPAPPAVLSSQPCSLYHMAGPFRAPFSGPRLDGRGADSLKSSDFRPWWGSSAG